MEKTVSFWLIPQDDQKSFLQDIITSLAHEHSAPVFEPHITVFNGRFSDDESIKVIEKTMNDVEPLGLGIKDIEYTNEYTKTLFLSFNGNEALTSISEEMRRLCKYHSEFILKPHLSLIYKTMKESTQARLVHEITIPISKIIFDEVKVISTASIVRKQDDVRDWRIVHIKSLMKK